MEEMKVHVALFPFPEQGHINPMLQLALHLASRGAFVTLINTPLTHQKHIQQFSHISSHLRFECIHDGLPAHQVSLTLDVTISGSRDHSGIASSAMPALLQSLEKQGPALEKLLSDLNGVPDWPPLSCLISDTFLHWTGVVARKLQLFWMVFWTASATRLCLTVRALGDEAQEHNSSVNIPGLPLICNNTSELSPVHNPQKLKILQARVNAIKNADMILVNTFDEIEAEAIKGFPLELPPVRSLGPLCLGAGADHKLGASIADDECLTWLNKQASHSVLYISFGSKVVLQGEPLEQLALGIEASKKPFLWVLRSGRENLPNGFLERTKERSIMMSWVPQKVVLEHSAVGAFFTHCGWNSVLEAIVGGTPMICWPTFADQPLNRVLIEQKWRIGRGVEEAELDGDGIEQVIQDVMGNRDFRERALILGLSAKAAMRQGGISDQNLSALLSMMWQSRVHHF